MNDSDSNQDKSIQPSVSSTIQDLKAEKGDGENQDDHYEQVTRNNIERLTKIANKYSWNDKDGDSTQTKVPVLGSFHQWKIFP